MIHNDVLACQCWAGKTCMYYWPINMYNSKLEMSYRGGFAFIHIQGSVIPDFFPRPMMKCYININIVLQPHRIVSPVYLSVVAVAT